MPLLITDVTKRRSGRQIELTYKQHAISGTARRDAPLSVSTDAIPPSLRCSPVIAVVVTTVDGALLSANETFCSLLGYTSARELLTKNVTSDVLADPNDWSLWKNAGTESDDVEVRLVACDGRQVLLRGSVERLPTPDGRADRLRGVFVPSGGARQSRDLPLLTAGMDGLVRVVSGVCHDFNNLLTVVIANLDIASEEVRDPDVHARLERAAAAAKQGGELSRQLMTFAYDVGSHTPVAVVDLGKVVKSLLALFAAALGSKVTLQTRIEPDALPVRVNPTQLQIVLMSIVIQARDAVAAAAKPAVILQVTRAHLDTLVAGKHGLSCGEYVAFKVRASRGEAADTDAGPEFADVASVREKPRAGGFGLPMIREFAQSFGGAASLANAAGREPCLAMVLPACRTSRKDGPVSPG
jgi:signal transduction histidine kinase